LRLGLLDTGAGGLAMAGAIALVATQKTRWPSAARVANSARFRGCLRKALQKCASGGSRPRNAGV